MFRPCLALLMVLVSAPLWAQGERPLTEVLAGLDDQQTHAAVLAELRVGGEPIVVELESLLLEDPDKTVRARAAVALSQLAPPRSAPALARALHTDEWFLVRIHAMLALSQLGDVSIPEINRAVRDGPDGLRSIAQILLRAKATGIKAKGGSLWTTLLGFYWQDLLLLLLVAFAWTGIASRFHWDPQGRIGRSLQMLLVFAPPFLLVGMSVGSTVMPLWYAGFRPEVGETLWLPLPYALTFSLAMIPALAGLWAIACMRTPVDQ